MTHSHITCDEAVVLASDRLDGALSDTQQAQLDSHLAGCAECRAVAADLEKLHADAAALPTLTPSHDLWGGIEARIQAPVVSLENHRRPLARWSVRQVAAAAAVLMAVTAGGTWVVASRSTTTPSSATVASNPRAARPELVAVAAEKGVATYEGAISSLRNIIETRRSDLDSATVAVLEKNLKLIDKAIAESKAALAADPASAFLADQLSRAYDTKLELLRSAALLPSRT
ncbi:MAG: zf-HC2 domain-containing protein [Gemmatimonadaceae bacterium]|nr:zf-HC2 domain-containing protein [Gemmatimonadaceae bacterium]